MENMLRTKVLNDRSQRYAIKDLLGVVDSKDPIDAIEDLKTVLAIKEEELEHTLAH